MVKKICYLSGGTNVPSVRFRLPFYERLKGNGHDCRIFHGRPSRYDHYPLIGWRPSQQTRKLIRHWHRLRIGLGRFDSVVIETGLFHTNDSSFEEALRKVAKRLVYEIDDAVFLLFPEKCSRIASIADHVIAGNERLAQWARSHNGSVSVIPTCVDERVYTPRDYSMSKEVDSPVIGWIGSSGNVRLLGSIAKPLRELTSIANYRLRVITNVCNGLNEIDLSGVNVDLIDIDDCSVIDELHRFDIGIMPLDTNDPWMQYKCNAKMIQYMGTAIPAVGTALGFNHELVTHRVNGMLAGSDFEWLSCLRELIESSQLRQKLGIAGRESALARYTVQSQIDNYEAAILGAP